MDLSTTIAPKSDQLNADDLTAGPLTIRITKISGNPESPDQPVSIFFEGDGGRPYRPCKSMRRVLVQVWGKYSDTYPGRSMTLYRDPAVIWGGLALGGIRISHMSHIEERVTMVLTESKAKRKPYTVQPLAEPAPTEDKAAMGTDQLIFRTLSTTTLAELETMLGDTKTQRDWLAKHRPELDEKVRQALGVMKAKFAPPVENAPDLPPADASAETLT